jgi:hypothetical protein
LFIYLKIYFSNCNLCEEFKITSCRLLMTMAIRRCMSRLSILPYIRNISNFDLALLAKNGSFVIFFCNHKNRIKPRTTRSVFSLTIKLTSIQCKKRYCKTFKLTTVDIPFQITSNNTNDYFQNDITFPKCHLERTEDFI